MANVNWITTKVNFDVEEVDTRLRKVLTERFGAHADIRRFETSGCWDCYVGRDGYVCVNLVSKRRLTFKPGGHDWSSFLEAWLRNKLGAEYAGLCGGEDGDKSWVPDAGRFPSYTSWVNDLRSSWTLEDRERIIESVPADLR